MESAERDALEIMRRVEFLRSSNTLLIDEKIEIARKLVSIIEKHLQPEVER